MSKNVGVAPPPAPSPALLEAARLFVRDVRRRLVMPESVYRFSLRLRGASEAVLRPHPAPWRSTTLKCAAEWREAAESLEALGLPLHHDPPRCWDGFAALRLILAETEPEQRILDAGPRPRSPLVEWLYLLGYGSLEVLNPAFSRGFRRGPIRYMPGDPTRLPYGSGSFAAVSLLDVAGPEEGLESRLGEACRVLRPGGVLVLSARYWEVAPGGGASLGTGRHPIFTRRDLTELLESLRSSGLRPIGPVDLDVREPALHAPGTGPECTLVKVAFRKRVGSRP